MELVMVHVAVSTRTEKYGHNQQGRHEGAVVATCTW